MNLPIRLTVFAATSLALIPTAWAQPEATPPSQIKVLADQLRDYAARWAAAELGEEDGVEIAAMLEVIRYDSASVGALREQLIQARSPEELFVANRLLMPLQQAPAPVIRGVLKDTQELHRRFSQYQVPARIPDRNLPEFRGAVSADLLMSSIAGSQRGTEEKIDSEMAMVRHNAEVHRLGQTLAVLTALAEDEQEDAGLVRELSRLEQSGSMEYADVVDAIVSAAPKMSPKRAAFFYDALVELGNRLGRKRAKYKCPWEIIVRVMKTSTAVEKEDSPGVRLLEAANVLAPIAGRDTVEIPGRRESREPARRAPRRPRR